MATMEDKSSGVCVICSQPANTPCAGCADIEVDGVRASTLYCGKDCQRQGWPTHKTICQAAQARKKLFRAAELIQETFYTVRADVFELNITKAECHGDGTIHIFDATVDSPGHLTSAPAWADGDADIQHAVLSYSAGADVFSNYPHELTVEALEGYTARIEEVDVKISDFHVLIRHHTKGRTQVASQNTHHVVRVTLKDGTGWVLDPAGAQYGQRKAVLPSAEYKQEFVARILARRPFGTNEFNPEQFVGERHLQASPQCFTCAFVLNQILEDMADEIAEWQTAYTTIEALIKTTNAVEYQRLKMLLFDHLATTARAAVEYTNGPPGSASNEFQMRRPSQKSERRRERALRKRARKWANMDPAAQEIFERDPTQVWAG